MVVAANGVFRRLQPGNVNVSLYTIRPMYFGLIGIYNLREMGNGNVWKLYIG